MVSLRRYVYRPSLATLICIGVGLLCAASIIWYWQAVESDIRATEARTDAFRVSTDQQIVAVKAHREQERRADEAARAMADRAASGNVSVDAMGDATICNRGAVHTDPMQLDIIVNKKHCIQPIDFAPSDLVTVHGATLRAPAAESFSQLYAAAVAVGRAFHVTSSYRSYQSQVSTYAYWVSVSGRDGADTYSARPGYSEHQTGLAFDVAASGCVLDCFGSTPQYSWLKEHAAEYGFIQRYYAGEESTTGYKAEE